MLNQLEFSHHQPIILGFVSGSVFQKTPQLKVGYIVSYNSLVHIIAVFQQILEWLSADRLIIEVQCHTIKISYLIDVVLFILITILLF